MPHEMAATRGLAAAVSLMFSNPSGVSVAIRRSRVDPNGMPCRCSRRSRIAATLRTSPAVFGLGTM